MEKEENYEQKAKNIFQLMNKYRAAPREFARVLEKLKTYLDPGTNILSEPGKIQIQMVEGEKVFDEAIHFLRNLKPLKPLIWEESLAKSAQEHVDDIGPKGLLLYQSSDGTEPEDRITKYGTYVDALGENIDFGPNDEIGVIISLTLDDGEEERPHRENIFKNNYQKVGIACGNHQTEFQMCVMDFAYDFLPKKNNTKKPQAIGNEMNDEDNEKDQIRKNQQNPAVNNQSPFVKLSLDNDDYKNFKAMDEESKRRILMEANKNFQGQTQEFNEIEQLSQQVKNINLNKRVVKRTVEVITKVTYTYEDGTTREVNDKQTHVFSP